MSDGVKIAIIGVIFGLLDSITGQLEKVQGILVSFGIKKQPMWFSCLNHLH